MKRTRNILMAVLLISALIGVAISMLFETETLESGGMDVNGSTHFRITLIMEIMTIAVIPSALYMFRWKPISQKLADGKEKALLRWGTLRILMLALPMIANTIFYYAYAYEVTFAYMGIILLLCLVFVFPTLERCMQECGLVVVCDNKQTK